MFLLYSKNYIIFLKKKNLNFTFSFLHLSERVRSTKCLLIRYLLVGKNTACQKYEDWWLTYFNFIIQSHCWSTICVFKLILYPQNKLICLFFKYLRNLQITLEKWLDECLENICMKNFCTLPSDLIKILHVTALQS